MIKEGLMAAIKQVKGIADEGKKAAKMVNSREFKEKIKEFRALKAETYEAGESNKNINILRRMNRLKKRTRKAA